MNRNAISRKIRQHGATFILKTVDTLNTVIPFSAHLKDADILMVAAIELQLGSIIAPLARPSREYIVATMTDKKLFEEYQLLRVNCSGTLTRANFNQPRDTFGRLASANPDTVYADIPLHLHQSAGTTNKDTPDRASTQTVYRFTTPTGYSLKPKDRLTIGDMTMTVSTIILTPDHLTTFEAAAIV